jgi:hypothetical protein
MITLAYCVYRNTGQLLRRVDWIVSVEPSAGLETAGQLLR